MKHLAILSMLCLVAVPALAAVPAKTELSLSAEFVNAKTDGPNPWTALMSLYIPVNKGGNIVLGPEIAFSDVDEFNRMGAGLDWNFFGQKTVTLFVGASADYFLKRVDEQDDYLVLARAGLKIPVGKGAAIRLAAGQIVDGRGKDDADMIATAGVIARF